MKYETVREECIILFSMRSPESWGKLRKVSLYESCAKGCTSGLIINWRRRWHGCFIILIPIKEFHFILMNPYVVKDCGGCNDVPRSTQLVIQFFGQARKSPFPNPKASLNSVSRFNLGLIVPPKRIPSILPCSNFTISAELSKIRLSCADPGHLTTMSMIRSCGPDTTWTLRDIHPFRFLNISALSPPGLLMGTCVQSMHPTTPGKLATS